MSGRVGNSRRHVLSCRGSIRISNYNVTHVIYMDMIHSNLLRTDSLELLVVSFEGSKIVQQ